MLPKVTATSNTNNIFKKENIASCLIIEDHLKMMLSKSSNYAYKPWNNKYAPKYPHTSFGNFTKEVVRGIKKHSEHKRTPDFEISQATTVNSNVNCFS